MKLGYKTKFFLKLLDVLCLIFWWRDSVPTSPSRMTTKLNNNFPIGPGMGRHTEEEIFQLGRKDLKTLSDFLEDKPYFMGDKPTMLDAFAFASAFGLLVNILRCPVESPLKEYARIDERRYSRSKNY